MVTETNIPYASQGELLCTTYKIFLDKIASAQTLEGVEQQKCVEIGIEVVKQLVESLDFKIGMAKDLFKIYVYVQGLLINYKLKKSNLEEAHYLIQIIYDSYKQIVEQEENKVPSMGNVETIYAGVTYGKGILNEMVMPSVNRGFRA